jgi:RNA polymerase sigma-70 factor (ECF subfamily)
VGVGDGESLALPVPRPRTARPRGDAALLRAAERGDAVAVAELFDRHWPALHRAAWLVCQDAQAAEDIAQEAFLAALARLDRFDRRRPLAPWLHRIAVNRAIDHVRARAARREVGATTVAEDVAAGARGGVDSAADAALADEITAALAALPPDQRAVVVLRHLLGYAPGEIAAMLDLPRGTVNSRLRRALDALAEGIER